MTNALRTMPRKLLVAMALLLVGVAVNLFSRHYLEALIGAGILTGLFLGKDVVRGYLVWCATFGLVAAPALAGIGLVLAPAAVTVGLLARVVVAMVVNGYLLWTLTRDDVRRWLFAQDFNLDVRELE